MLSAPALVCALERWTGRYFRDHPASADDAFSCARLFAFHGSRAELHLYIHPRERLEGELAGRVIIQQTSANEEAAAFKVQAEDLREESELRLVLTTPRATPPEQATGLLFRTLEALCRRLPEAPAAEERPLRPVDRLTLPAGFAFARTPDATEDEALSPLDILRASA